MPSDIKREVRVGPLTAGVRCKLCGCKGMPLPTPTMVQVTVVFPLPELGQRFSAVCQACAVAILDALNKPAGTLPG
jgi:hypothetical protein